MRITKESSPILDIAHWIISYIAAVVHTGIGHFSSNIFYFLV